MRILWIVNIQFPPLCDYLNKKTPSSGGWLYSSAQRLVATGSVELYVATFDEHGATPVDVTINGIRYFTIPYKNADTTKTHAFVRDYWKIINTKCNPDIVHIHGTEYAHGNDYIHACGAQHVIVSIQGLVGEISYYYTGGLSYKTILKHLSIRDILLRDSLFHQTKDFSRRGIIERDTLSMVCHIAGRTSWDLSHAWRINPSAEYHFCGETLREVFYKSKWSYDKCEPYSIFISQSIHPYKGLHKVLEALPIVLLHFPKTTVYVAGRDMVYKVPWYRRTGYGKIIKRIINKYKLDNHIVFTGELDETEMCKRYLMSNLFICSSSIENSPNSLGEAQMLNMPYLCSYVGGVADMVDSISCLYRFEDTDMLAYKICRIFELKEKAISHQEGNLRRYDANQNLLDLLNAYKLIHNQ